jgi:hypothetical protein
MNVSFRVGETWNREKISGVSPFLDFAFNSVEAGLEIEILMSKDFSRAFDEVGGKWVDGLWEYDVAEVFFLGDNGVYFEFEIDRVGNYLALDFDDVRQRRNEFKDLILKIDTEIQENGVIHKFVLPKAILPENIMAVNCCGILRNEIFLSLVDLSGIKADFHQPDKFLRLEI